MTDADDRRPGPDAVPPTHPEPDAVSPSHPEPDAVSPSHPEPDAVSPAGPPPEAAPPVEFVAPEATGGGEGPTDSIEHEARGHERRDTEIADVPPVGLHAYDDVDDAVADDLDDDDFGDDADDGDYGAFVPRRWVTMVTTLGLGLVTVAGAQLLAWLLEGFSLRRGEPDGVPNDLLHRLGNPFDRRVVTTLIFLLLALILLALPAILDEDSTATQDVWVNVALVATTVLAVIIALGAGLRVRYELNLYDQANRAVPRFFRIELVSFLLGTLGAAAIAVWGSLATMRLRDRWR